MRIAVTTGEPAGIGPEISVAALDALAPDVAVTLIGDRDLLAQHAVPVGVTIEPVALAVRASPGQLDARNARYVLATLDRAIRGCLGGEFAAIVTAPVHKGVINDAGVAFTGHTEYLAQRTASALPVMLLAAPGMRVALATTHLPLKAVSAAITVDSLLAIAAILDKDLRKWWGIESPRIAVCGLNPHAGEGGYLGDEEIKVIAPAVNLMRERGIRAT